MPGMARPRAVAAAQSILSTRISRAFTTTPRPRASILFALSSLSNSRETQHFNKITRLPRFEHSPPLKLIKQSEVDAYPLPEPDRPTARAIPLSSRIGNQQHGSPASWDAKAMKVGRAVLMANARREAILKLALKRTQQRAKKQHMMSGKEKAEWYKERAKLRNEMRIAGVWILASIGTATALATWRFWPQQQTHMDSGELGRRIASRARAAIPLPSARTAGELPVALPAVQAGGSTAGAASPASSNVVQASAVEHIAPAATIESTGAKTMATSHLPASPGSWWKGLFWKQS